MLEFLVEHWSDIIASAMVAIASIDKVGMVALKTVKNLMNEWNATFPKKGKFDIN